MRSEEDAMPRPRSIRHRVRALAAGFTVAAAAALAPATASAHFLLQAPSSWMSQDANGAPIKQGPCGDEGGGTPSGIVTAVQSGQTITVTVDEVIFHPGHYRIALAVHDRSELPAEPPVTPGSTPCGSAPVSPAQFPILADGVFEHSAPFSGPQSVQITLPAGVTCTHCTLQVIEFMSDHVLNVPGGCFYHHCADLSIQSAPVSGDGGGGNPLQPSTGGCGCGLIAGDLGVPSVASALVLAALLLRRRRR
jgi:hypothetical protein